MRNSRLNKILRRVVVILLAATMVAAVTFFIKTVSPTIEYLSAKSLANDAPIYGSTIDDLAVIERQYSDRYSVSTIFLAGVQMLVVFGISIAILHWLYPTHHKHSTVSNSDGEWDEVIKAAEFAELCKLLKDFEESGN